MLGFFKDLEMGLIGGVYANPCLQSFPCLSLMIYFSLWLGLVLFHLELKLFAGVPCQELSQWMFS